MSNRTINDARLLREAGLPSCFRPQDAKVAGISYSRLRRMETAGLVEREGRGLYRRTDADFTRHHNIAAVCARVPNAIVSLVTALSVHEIGTQIPHGVWIAIPHGSRTPTIQDVRLNVTRFSGASLRYGVVDTEFEGVPARITMPARTVVDCFRFRNKVGLDVALEALDDALRWNTVTRSQLLRAAEACRARSLIDPLLWARSW